MARPKASDPVKPYSFGLAESTWAEVDAKAEAAGFTRGQWVKDAVFAKLARENPPPVMDVSRMVPRGERVPPMRDVTPLWKPKKK